jgi:hypothetical protein
MHFLESAGDGRPRAVAEKLTDRLEETIRVLMQHEA